MGGGVGSKREGAVRGKGGGKWREAGRLRGGEEEGKR